MKWISLLPDIVDRLANYWKLRNVIPVDNMTFNYVAKAFTNSGQPVVLKISCDAKSITQEKDALLYFNGNASVKLIDYKKEFNALLLEQAIPGNTLKKFYPNQIEFVMNCYIDTMQKLHNKKLPKNSNYQHISEWLTAIDKLDSSQIPAKILDHAIYLKKTLLTSLGREIFLHGDLHHDNIIQNNNQWLAIDPKGIIGEAELEIAAFDFIQGSEVINPFEIKKIFEKRVALIAKKSNLDFQRIKNWVFVRLILMAAWSIEDNCDPSWAVKLAENIG